MYRTNIQQHSGSSLPLAPLAPVLWCPLDALGVNPDLPLWHRASVAFQHLWSQADDILPFVVLYQVQMLQCGHYVLLAYARLLTYLTAKIKIIHSWADHQWIGQYTVRKMHCFFSLCISCGNSTPGTACKIIFRAIPHALFYLPFSRLWLCPPAHTHSS